MFYLKLGAITNEVAALNKMVQFCLPTAEQEEAEKAIGRGSHANALLLLRLLCGRLYEAHLTILTNYKPLKDLYNPKIKGDGLLGYRSITAYFHDDQNLIKAVRHRLAFHNDPEAFENGADSLEDDEEIVDYMAINRGNCLFWTSEAVLIGALRQLAQGAESQVVYERLMDETAKIAGALSNFTFAFAQAFYKRHFPTKLRELGTTSPVEVPGPPLTVPSIPFFVEAPERRKPPPHSLGTRRGRH